MHVRPELVVEIAFDGVQASPRYPGRRGAALRPRAALPRRQAADEADTLDMVLALGRPVVAEAARASPVRFSCAANRRLAGPPGGIYTSPVGRGQCRDMRTLKSRCEHSQRTGCVGRFPVRDELPALGDASFPIRPGPDRLAARSPGALPQHVPALAVKYLGAPAALYGSVGYLQRMPHEPRSRRTPARHRQALRRDHGGRRPRPRRAGGHLRRPARPERRRQVDHHADC